VENSTRQREKKDMFNFGKRKTVALYRENLAAWERHLYTSRPVPHPLAYFSGGDNGADAFFNICIDVTDETMEQFLRLWATNDVRIQKSLEDAWSFVELRVYPQDTINNFVNGKHVPMDEALRQIARVRQAAKIVALAS